MSSFVQRQSSRHEEQEYGPGRRGFVVCPSCAAVHTGKRWVASFVNVRNATSDKTVRFRRCPACEMIFSKKFEGQVVLTHVPLVRMADVLARIAHMDKVARRQDPMDRIIHVRRSGHRVEVTTTENQLAVRIGKAVKSLLKGKLTIRWSKEEDIVRLLWIPK